MSDSGFENELVGILQPYRYSPLTEEWNIRLMELKPGHGSEPLVCHLFMVSVWYGMQYDALSYTWGNSPDRYNLYHEHGDPTRPDAATTVLEITRGLYEALVQLRDVSKSRTLWADAVCIDQGNLSERGEQVKIMRHIYRRAKNVLIWLGPEDQKTQAAVDMITKMNKANTLRHGSYFQMLCWQYERNDSESLVALQQLYHRPWFRRIWVVQEVTAASSIIVHIGSYAIRWNDLRLATEWLDAWRNGDSKVPSVIDDTVEGRMSQRNALFMQQDRRTLESMTTPELLNISRNYLATDTRDKVYALFGVSKIRKLSSDFKPDYTKSPQEVYELVTLLAMKSSRTLEILHYIDDPLSADEKLTWPSWIARWDKPTFYRSFPLQVSQLYKGRSHGILSLVEEPRGGVLKLQGVIVGRVSDVAQHLTWVSTNTGTTLRNFTDLAQFWEDIVQRNREDIIRRPQNESFRTQHPFPGLAQALTAGLDANHKFAARNIVKHTADVLDFLLHSLESTPPSSLGEHIVSLHSELPQGERYLCEQNIERICTNRRLFYTHDRRFGLGPQAVQPGDVIVILYGGFTPFVLRPSGDQFLLLGECYVNQMMGPRALQRYRYENGIEELEDRVFELK